MEGMHARLKRFESALPAGDEDLGPMMREQLIKLAKRMGYSCWPGLF